MIHVVLRNVVSLYVLKDLTKFHVSKVYIYMCIKYHVLYVVLLRILFFCFYFFGKLHLQGVTKKGVPRGYT